MKKLALILFLLLQTISYGQDKIIGGIPVKGIISIKRTDSSTPITSKVDNASNTSIVAGTPTGSSTEVGVTQGQLSVSLTGGANYNIPIEVPSGINGVVPQIGLSYNSQGGNGNAGYGWNISGISKISRIASTKFHDGINDPVDFNNLDRFALDGQRLIVKNGTSIYGNDGTVYETENFSNIKVTSYGITPWSSSKGPNYFIVEYPDGSKAKYGGTWETTSVVDWAIQYWENPQGIRITYNWGMQGGGNIFLQSIFYGHTGVFTGTGNFNQISFIYKQRNRLESAGMNGVTFADSKILSEIIIKSNTIGYKNYLLGHDNSSLGYERLTKITEKSGDNTKSYNPTVFSYETTPETVLYNQISTTLSVNNISFLNSSNLSGDFDGDGQRDIILYPTTGSDAKKKYWLFTGIENGSLNIGSEHNVGVFDDIFPITWLGGTSSYGYKLMPMQGWCVMKKNATTNITSFTNYSTGTASPIYFQDNKDYIFPKFNTTTETIEYTGANTTNLKNIAKKFVSGDFNGDGLSDVLAIELNTTFHINTIGLKNSNISSIIPIDGGGGGGYDVSYTGQTYLVNLDRRLTTNYVSIVGNINVTSANNLIVDDVNGDGKSDLLVFAPGYVSVYTINQSNNQLQLLATTSDGFISLNNPILMGDYNGDGKADFIIPKGYGNNYAKFTSNGGRFNREDVTYDIPYVQNGMFNNCSYSYYIIPSDFDQDGKTDLIFSQNIGCSASGTGSIFVINYKNTGTNFAPAGLASTGIISGIGSYATPVFLNSDKQISRNEINFFTKNKVIHFNSQKDFSKDRLLKSITLGNGLSEAITYSSLKPTDSSSYSDTYFPSTYVENYPNFDILSAPSFQVVASLEKAGSFGYKRQKYFYADAVTNIEGLGFLGFRAIAKTNWHNDNFTAFTTFSKFDLLKRGAITESFSLQGVPYNNFANINSTGFINKSVMTYTDQLLPNKVYKLNNTLTIDTNALDGTSKEATTTYDSVYNYPLSYTTVTKNGSTVEQTEIINLDYFNSTLSGNYYIGRPRIKSTSVNNNSDTKTSEEEYSYTNNLLTQSKKKGHLTDYIIEDNIYDSFGNITSKTISANPLSPRSTNYEYDPSGRFLTKSTDIEGLATNYTYDTSKGWLTKVTNPFGLETNYLYDVWGKKIKTTDYLGKSVTSTYNNTQVLNLSTKIILTGDDGNSQEVYYDNLGREIITGSKNINSTWSYVKNSYDIYDRKISLGEPVASITDNPTQFSTSTFDDYGRLIKTITHTGKTTDITYSGLTTTVNDGVKTISTTNNSLGSPLSVTDNGGTIKYTYDANGNLIASESPLARIDMEYDGWDRKITLIDPSAGTYRYEYNALGETTKEITPNGETNYELNEFGKLTLKTIEGNLTSSKSTYEYDPTTKRLSSSSFYDNIEGSQTDYTYTYDAFQRIVKTTEDNPTTAHFEHETTYDSFGRPLKELYKALNYIDSKESSKWIRNTYKNGGHWQILDDASSQVLWQTNNVNLRGQLTSATLGNGINIANTYDAFGFISQIKHDKAVSPFTNIMTLNTAFQQQRGNLTNRYNSLFDYREDYTYDNLDRLTSWKETGDLLWNCNFTTNTEGFQSLGSSSINNTSGQLNVSATGSGSGVQKLVLSNAVIGKKINIKGKLAINTSGTSSTVNISFYEKDPVSGAMINNTTLGMPISGGDFSFGTTVTTYSDIYVKIVMNNTLNPTSSFLPFSLDDIKITLEKVSTQDYDQQGRITGNKLGVYNYANSTKQYQNTSIFITPEANSYYGSRPLQNVTYNAFKSPVNITEDSIEKVDFVYNDFNSRSAMYYDGLDDDKMNRNKRKFYSADGTMEIKYNLSGNSEFITYIGGNAYSAPLLLKSDGTTEEYLYLHRDYQGSIMAISNQVGNVLEKRLFDAWGSITKVQDGVGNDLAGLTVLDRGYTGHEHLEKVGLIHMNGRLYDPKLHRFLQPDNNIQDPYNTQNYNRYGYVLNNPLKYTDPSGEDYWLNGQCIECQGQNSGLSNTQQTWIGNGIATIAQNWDNWGIKNWSNKNLNFNSWGNGLSSAGNFIGRNVESVGGWFVRNFNSLFGTGKKEQAPRYIPSTPTFSNHQLSNGWQNEGFSGGNSGLGQRSDKIIMNTIRNNPALNQQYKRILDKHPNYYLKYVDELGRDEGKTFGLNNEKTNVHSSYTEIYRAGYGNNGKPLADLKYVIMHEFGHVWSSISGNRAGNFKIYNEYSSMPVWLDEVYADLYAQHWGGWALTSQSYILNLSWIKGSTYYENGLVKFPKRF